MMQSKKDETETSFLEYLKTKKKNEKRITYASIEENTVIIKYAIFKIEKKILTWRTRFLSNVWKEKSNLCVQTVDGREFEFSIPTKQDWL